MKYVILLLSGCILSCSSSKRSQTLTGISKAIYSSQRLYYNTTLAENPDFNGFISFASHGRPMLFKKNNVVLDLMDSCTILEGFNPAFGYYKGLLITKSESWFYTKSNASGWLFSKIDIVSSDFEQKTGISRELLKTVSAWDTTYINSLKKQTGNIVHDGYSFWGCKVENINGRPFVHNYAFYEYPVRIKN